MAIEIYYITYKYARDATKHKAYDRGESAAEVRAKFLKSMNRSIKPIYLPIKIISVVKKK
jgi:hypothetical protein